MPAALDPLPHTRPAAARAEIDAWAAVHRHSFQRLWHVDFHVLEEMPLSLRPLDLGRQVVVGPGYRSEGRLRAGEDHCYFCYTLGGAGVGWDARGEYALTPGQGFLIEISDPRAGYRAAGGPVPPWQFLAFTFTGLAAQAMTRDLAARYGGAFPLALHAPIVQRLLSHEAKSYRVLHPHAVDGAELVIELLLALAAAARAGEEPDAAKDLVQRALRLIEEGSDAPLNVQELAHRLGISRERLSRVFRQHLNLPPHQFIQEQKIRRACFLLKDTEQSVKQIAAHLGYADYTNFIRAFRQVAQMTPREFQRRGSIPFLARRLGR